MALPALSCELYSSLHSRMTVLLTSAIVIDTRARETPTIYNPVFPDSVLVVDEAISVNVVTEANEIIAHFLDVFLSDQRLAATQRPT